MPRANQKCPKCTKPRINSLGCSEHQPVNWRDKDRHNTPYGPGWSAQRRRVLRRDPDCQLSYDGCTRASTHADHIIPFFISGKRTVTDEELQGVCASCHQKKSQSEAQLAKVLKRGGGQPPSVF